MRAVAQMVIMEVAVLGDPADTYRVHMRNCICDAIGESYQLGPGSTTMEMVVTGVRGKWYLENVGNYVKMEVSKWLIE